jgi:trimethylamine---corrinoid protein Co-methyltransferase
MIYGLGMLEGGLTWDYAQMVMHNEMARMIMHTVKGIPVSDEKMAVEVVRSVGPGGEFLSHNHTFKNFKELSKAQLIDRRNREAWLADGAEDIVTRSYRKAQDILENFQNPSPLPENIQNQLKEIVKEAEAETTEIKAKEKEASKKAAKF